MASLAPSHRQSQSSVQTFLSNDYPETNHTVYDEVLSWFPAESERLVEAERVAEANLTDFSSSMAKSWNSKAELQGSSIAEIKDREMASWMEARRARADLNDKIIGALHGVLNRLEPSLLATSEFSGALTDDAKFQEVMQRYAGRELADLDRVEVNLAAEAFNKSMELIVPTPEVSEFSSLATATIGSGGASGLETREIDGEQDDQLLFFGLPITDPSPPDVVTEEVQKQMRVLKVRAQNTRHSNRILQIDIRSGGDRFRQNVLLKWRILREIHSAMKVFGLISQSHLDRNVVIDRTAHTKMIEVANCLASYAVMIENEQNFSCRCRLHSDHGARDKSSDTLNSWLNPKLALVRKAAMQAESQIKKLWSENLRATV